MFLKLPKFKLITLVIILFGPVLLYSQNADELKNKIDQKNLQIKQLEEEIKQYNIEVNNANTQSKNLINTIKTLDLSKKKITKDITLTEKKIEKTNLNIEEINNNILKTVDKIEVNKKAIAKAIQNTQIIDDNSIVVTLLSKKTVGDIWNEIDITEKISESIRLNSKELGILKVDLESKENNLSKQKSSLVSLKGDLDGKKKAVEYTVQQKASVLVETKNKEKVFRDLVKTKEDQKAQFEKEVYDFESQLNILIDKGSYPAPRKGILSWPLDDVYITQRFGKTVGAERLYKSGSHNGVDFRASIGTRVKNVLTGTVVGTGNTDVPGCYSFGKWVMVKHDNGLSTIYGHLSVISAVQGQRINTGDLIGFSGNTGYSTGPHLHISVYATQGVRIERYVNSRGCKSVVLPLADVKAYLDPLDYLPSV